MSEQDISEGEQVIKEFLEEKDIKFKREFKIPNLKYDDIPYRRADFYLPQYKVYIEFFGLWNLEKHKLSYLKKKEVYQKNRIPCLYFYPENLGIIDFLFKRRLKKLLIEHNLKWQLFRYNLLIYREEHLIYILIFALLAYFIDDIRARIIFSILLILSLYNTIKNTFFE